MQYSLEGAAPRLLEQYSFLKFCLQGRETDFLSITQ